MRAQRHSSNCSGYRIAAGTPFIADLRDPFQGDANSSRLVVADSLTEPWRIQADRLIAMIG